jgi:D-glycero-alpha-D-manno-heptose-7-phosphate kinase
MIISRTPFRISFAGGGSDLKEYYSLTSGAVLSVTIDKYVYLSMHPYFIENKILLKYSNNELINDVNDIKHPIIKTVFKDYDLSGVDLSSSADIPSGTGLASSSAFTAGLINLCNTYMHKYMTKEEIAKYACDIEINKLGEPIGKQDQYACSIGGLNFIEFHRDDTVSVERIHLNHESMQKLENNLLLFYLGTNRSANSILFEQRQKTINEQVNINNLDKMVKLAWDLKAELLQNNIDSIGEILHQGWMYKKELASKISNSNIDSIYDLALKNGAEGGKLLGAGGGGFLLFYVKQENQQRLRTALSDLSELKFKFDSTGTTIIY